MRTDKHEPPYPDQEDNGCNPNMHCAIHNVDEPADGAYIICMECNHVYRTAWSLKRAYIRFAWEATRFNDRYPPMLAGLDMLRALLTPVSRFTFCQECSHDF